MGGAGGSAKLPPGIPAGLPARRPSGAGRRCRGVPTYQASALQAGASLKPLRFSQPGGAPRGATERARSAPRSQQRGGGARGCADAEADMPSAEASGAMCVQRFDGSRNSAIHTTYRISLRSSSIREPRYPLLRVVFWLCKRGGRAAWLQSGLGFGVKSWMNFRRAGCRSSEEEGGPTPAGPGAGAEPRRGDRRPGLPKQPIRGTVVTRCGFDRFNDPSAGSPR